MINCSHCGNSLLLDSYSGITKNPETRFTVYGTPESIRNLQSLILRYESEKSRAGSAKSEAKSNAARENGKKGGRPKVVK